MSSEGRSAEVEPGAEAERLDVFVSRVAGVSRNRAQMMIAGGLVLVDGEPARKNHCVAPGETVRWEPGRDHLVDIAGQDLPLNVVFEDSDVVVIDKPAGMVMYPGPGHPSQTVLNALLFRYPDIRKVGSEGRPGVFHRLDKGTSGLVAFAVSARAYERMVIQIQDRQVVRGYTALVSGSIPCEAGTIDAPMARSRKDRKRMAVDVATGREAVTTFEVSERFGADFTLMDVRLQTGRTHQIRVHFAHIGHPVTGDPEYSRRTRASKWLGLDRQFLHASKLAFAHPISGEPLSFASELPGDLSRALDALRARYRDSKWTGA